MHNLSHIDEGMDIVWGKTSRDYARFRLGPPPSLYKRMEQAGVGLSGQRILDLGTGTGVLAQQFTKQGAIVSGIDISEGQIKMAQSLAKDVNLSIDFQVSDANKLPFENNQFDAITVNQCFLYFDKKLIIPEIKRVLKDGGIFSTSHFSWMPFLDSTAMKSEELILKHNPSWSAHSYKGEIPDFPSWAQKDFDLKGTFQFNEEIPFTWESWCGRIRACRGIGAALSEEAVEKFNQEHLEMLKNTVPENFSVFHRIDAHFYSVRK